MFATSTFPFAFELCGAIFEWSKPNRAFNSETIELANSGPLSVMIFNGIKWTEMYERSTCATDSPSMFASGYSLLCPENALTIAKMCLFPLFVSFPPPVQSRCTVMPGYSEWY